MQDNNCSEKDTKSKSKIKIKGKFPINKTIFLFKIEVCIY